MTHDPLDKRISVGVELTEAGLNANARSRAAAALDRLVGNLVDFVNLPVEASNVRSRTKIEAERQLMDAMRKHAIGRMKTDAEFADRAVSSYLRSIGIRQENKDGVARHAIEDLRRDPSASGKASDLDPLFVDKLERHAEEASTEALREKWGRVLAAEVREPGSFAPKVLRVVDELDGQTARVFEEVCNFRLNDVIPRTLSGVLEFEKITRLVEAGLLLDPGEGGQLQYFVESTHTSNPDDKIWMLGTGEVAIGIRDISSLSRQPLMSTEPIGLYEGQPVIPVYILTQAGHAVSRILPKRDEEVLEAYAQKLEQSYGDVLRLKRVEGGYSAR
ncbi:DUF2806 domain-containing protein [Bradyrhizobium liaoningense]